MSAWAAAAVWMAETAWVMESSGEDGKRRFARAMVIIVGIG
jgi:hypothetical protein